MAVPSRGRDGPSSQRHDDFAEDGTANSLLGQMLVTCNRYLALLEPLHFYLIRTYLCIYLPYLDIVIRTVLRYEDTVMITTMDKPGGMHLPWDKVKEMGEINKPTKEGIKTPRGTILSKSLK